MVLLGDAAWGVTLGGMGVGTSVVGAHILAGELAAARGDHRAAFPCYEQRIRSYAAAWQRGASPGRFLAPRTRSGLWLRYALFKSAAVRRFMVSATRSRAAVGSRKSRLRRAAIRSVLVDQPTETIVADDP